MDPRRWEQVEGVFFEALELDVDERARLLAERCRDDPELLSEVQAMLRAADEDTWLSVGEKIAPGLDDDSARFGAIGSTVSHYRIVEELGRGGMGAVYRAEDTRLGRQVALKLLPPDLLRHPEARERFKLEARAAAAMDHPAICTIYEVDETADGRLLIAMAHYDGATLKARLAQGPLSVEEAVDIARQVAAGLALAHEGGIVHRDIKPANIMVTPRGEAKILDFGVAKVVGDTDLTRPGTTLGTLKYMAPEQASAESVGPPADLWALGVVLYEMIAGRPPFERERAVEVQVAIMAAEAPPLDSVRPDLPPGLTALVAALLAKRPEARPASAHEVARQLGDLATELDRSPVRSDSASTPGTPGPARRRRRSRTLRTVAVLSVIGVAAAGVWRWNNARALERWARQEGLPEVLRLVERNQWREAGLLALDVDAVLRADPVLEPLWPRITTPFSVRSEPAGARVSFRAFGSEDAPWRSLGTTPLRLDRFPVGAFRFRIEHDGFETLEVARSTISAHQLSEIANAGFDYLGDPSYVIDVRLSRPGDMLPVTGGPYGTVPLAGFGPLQPLEIPDFAIDRTEVTNEAYQAFIAAGAYADTSLWREPFFDDGRRVPAAEALGRFTDATGRPGPATWTLAAPPSGQERYPVTGVSWYEAAAYCSWRGASLPTLFHWARATLPSSEPWLPFAPHLAATSNFGDGPAPVASHGAVAVSGAHDLVGNAREWVSTSAGEHRFRLGGAWSDPTYLSFEAWAAPPWQRGPTDGFRCVRYPDDAVPEHLRQDMERPVQDFTAALPSSDALSDAAFQEARRLHAYDPGLPLAATVDSTADLDWGATREWVTIDAAYGERLPLRIHIPAGAEPPYQAVVFFPGGNLLFSVHFEDIDVLPLDFLVRSGRVLVEPMYDGTFQRNEGRTVQRWAGPAARRELIRHWVQDLGRTLDYLDARSDIDAAKVSFLGMSLGADLAPNLLVHEPRFGAAILYSGGFAPSESQASIDERTELARRVTLPVLMLGGRNDFASPTEPHQGAMLRAFGTPEADKHRRVYEAGHWPLPLTEVMRETVDFLDRYLGPVHRRGSSPDPPPSIQGPP